MIVGEIMTISKEEIGNAINEFLMDKDKSLEDKKYVIKRREELRKLINAYTPEGIFKSIENDVFSELQVEGDRISERINQMASEEELNISA
jgi:hypothetical protein